MKKIFNLFSSGAWSKFFICGLTPIAGFFIFFIVLKTAPCSWLKVLPPPSPLKLPWLPVLLATPFWLLGFYCYLVFIWQQCRDHYALHRIKNRESLLKLSWQQFEVLVAEFYRLRGFRVVECGGGGPDGGVDLRLYRGRKLILVQCKHWNSRVGVKPVRELYGLMAAEQAQMGILVATSDFSLEAKRFAEGKAVQLVSGDLLLDWLQKP